MPFAMAPPGEGPSMNPHACLKSIGVNGEHVPVVCSGSTENGYLDGCGNYLPLDTEAKPGQQVSTTHRALLRPSPRQRPCDASDLGCCWIGPAISMWLCGHSFPSLHSSRSWVCIRPRDGVMHRRCSGPQSCRAAAHQHVAHDGVIGPPHKMSAVHHLAVATARTRRPLWLQSR